MSAPEIIDYTSMDPKDFWALVDKQAETAQKRVEQLFRRAGTSDRLDVRQATDCLNLLFIDSHRRLREQYPDIAQYYPTKHVILNALKTAQDLWWVDHTTSHISTASVLKFFSNQETLSGFSTHFLVGYRELPLYLVPLVHGAVHEPHRNQDSISLSVMNAGGLSKNGVRWNFWAGEVPQRMITDLSPIRLSTPYRGFAALQPYTTEQIKNAIIIKRIVVSALRSKIDISRFTQHTDWDTYVVDMGPLWPSEQINNSAFENFPVWEHDFVQRYDSTLTHESIEEADKNSGINTQNPEFSMSGTDILPSIEQVQLALCQAGIKVKINNKYDSTTRNALQKFQTKWNQTHLDSQLDTNGIPNLPTYKCLQEEGK